MFGYPLMMVIAEKTVTMMQRREASTRWRDFVEVVMISRRLFFIAGDLRSAMELVANHRREPLLMLVPGLDGMAELAQTKWGRWRGNQANAEDLPELFEEVIAVVAHLIAPIVHAPNSLHTWRPETDSWA